MSAPPTFTKTVEVSPTVAMDKPTLIPPAHEVVAMTSVALKGALGSHQGSANNIATTTCVELDLDGGCSQKPQQPSHPTSNVDDVCDEVRSASRPTVDTGGNAVLQELEGRSDRASTSNTSKSPEEEEVRPTSSANVGAREHATDQEPDNIGSIVAQSREEERDGAVATDVSPRDCDSADTTARSSSKVVEESSSVRDKEEEASCCGAGKRVIAGEVGPTTETMLELAEKALAALYEVHDTFFSADKGDKEVCLPLFSSQYVCPPMFCSRLLRLWRVSHIFVQHSSRSTVRHLIHTRYSIPPYHSLQLRSAIFSAKRW